MNATVDHSRFDDIFGDDDNNGDDVSLESALAARQMQPKTTKVVKVFDYELGWVEEYVTVDAPKAEVKQVETAPASKQLLPDTQPIFSINEIVEVRGQNWIVEQVKVNGYRKWLYFFKQLENGYCIPPAQESEINRIIG